MKISIITASLNRKEFIGAAIESVLTQNYSDFEHWIIDGGSSDGTLEYLQKYPHLKVLSEPDLGVYDAWNKGIDRATGDFVAILNSDDVYAPGAFENCAKAVAAVSSVLMVSGGCQIYRRGLQGNEIEMHRYQDPRRYRLSLQNATVGLPIINSRFFRRSLFDQLGGFDLTYAVASDRDFLIRASLAGIKDVTSSEIFYRYLWHPGSLTMNAGNRSMLTGLQDGLEMIRKNRAAGFVDPANEKMLQDWQRELRATMVLVHAVMGEVPQALTVARESLLTDPRWPFTFLRCGGLAVARRLRTKWRTWLRASKQE